MAAIQTVVERRAMIRATASSEAVSVSIRNVRVIGGANQDDARFLEIALSSLNLLPLSDHKKKDS